MSLINEIRLRKKRIGNDELMKCQDEIQDEVIRRESISLKAKKIQKVN